MAKYYSFWPYSNKSEKYMTSHIKQIYTSQKDAIIGACLYVLTHQTYDADVVLCRNADNPKDAIKAIAKVHYSKKLKTVTYTKFTSAGKWEGMYEYKDGEFVKLSNHIDNGIERLIG